MSACANRHDTSLAAAAVPLLEDIFKAHTLQRNIVTFRLAKKDARATFGGLDPEMKGSVTYMPVRHHLVGYWDTTASVNGIGGSSTPAVLDTGATHTYVPLKMAEQIFTALNLTIVHSGSVSLGQYECSQAPPKITVRVGTFDIALSPRSTKLAREKSIRCFVNIIGGDVRPVDPFIIIGADVLSSECCGECLGARRPSPLLNLLAMQTCTSFLTGTRAASASRSATCQQTSTSRATSPTAHPTGRI